MKIGVFVPIGNNGWLISTTAPQYMPTFELNKAIVQKAEHYHFDFALSMIKLRGFGGKTEFWDHNLESFTLMAGLAAVTSRIQIYATAATLTLPPAIVARMASTIDSISGGRFGVNLVTGWQKPEYEQMGSGRATITSPPLRLPDRIRAGAARPVGHRQKRFQRRLLHHERLPRQPAAVAADEGDLRRAERRGDGILRPIRRLQLLLRQRGQHACRLRPDRRAHERGGGKNRARRGLLRAVYGDCRRNRRGGPRQMGALQGRRR
jgi:alkanesulfonate monooxygenase SsuD/methylene tetrahydromethanopterin reductase-like flavin-dependent oxidoreductase (luciferase family)